jgi:hypothetical protein
MTLNSSSLLAGGLLRPRPVFLGLFSRLLQYIHRRRYHRHYYTDWPYAVPPVITGDCFAPKGKNCGYHWKRVLEDGRMPPPEELRRLMGRNA